MKLFNSFRPAVAPGLSDVPQRPFKAHRIFAFDRRSDKDCAVPGKKMKIVIVLVPSIGLKVPEIQIILAVVGDQKIVFPIFVDQPVFHFPIIDDRIFVSIAE